MSNQSQTEETQVLGFVEAIIAVAAVIRGIYLMVIASSDLAQNSILVQILNAEIVVILGVLFVLIGVVGMVGMKVGQNVLRQLSLLLSGLLTTAISLAVFQFTEATVTSWLGNFTLAGVALTLFWAQRSHRTQ